MSDREWSCADGYEHPLTAYSPTSRAEILWEEITLQDHVANADFLSRFTAAYLSGDQSCRPPEDDILLEAHRTAADRMLYRMLPEERK